MPASDLTCYDVTLHDVQAEPAQKGTVWRIYFRDENGESNVINVAAHTATVIPKYDIQPGDIWQGRDGDVGQRIADGEHWRVLTIGSSREGDLVDDEWMVRPLTPIFTPRAGRSQPGGE